MDKSNLARRLLEINPWWNELDVPRSIKKADTHRRIFYDASKMIDSQRVYAITGPRQVGKTTLMGQLIDYQIKTKKINRKNIIYLPVDNEILRLYAHPENLLIACMDVYSSVILGESLVNLKQLVYVYLDEIQDLENWDKLIKTYFDTYPKLRFIITGSSHSLLQKGFRESLVGRINIRTLLPLKFSEFVMFREKISGEKDEERFNKKFGIWYLNSSFRASVRNENPNQLMDTIIGVENRLGILKKQVQNYLEEYLVGGGFPNSVTSQSLIEAAQVLKQDLELTVYKDIHRLFNTRDPSKMMAVLTSIAEQTNHPISMNQIAKKSETSWPIIDKFLDYFEQTFLINKISFYSNENSTTKSDMIKLNDTGILNTLLSQLFKKILDEDIYRLASTAATSHAVRLLFKTSQYLERKIYYWEEENNIIEVILTKPKLIPLGIAYDENILSDKINLVSKFMTKNKLKYGIVITKDSIDVKDNILLFPLWSFLLMC